MDSSLDLRMKFRQSIRRKNIEQIQKTKRQLHQKYLEEHSEQIQQQSLYSKIINNSSQVFSQPEKYLQMLRQALNSPYANQYKHMFSDVLLNLIKFYQDSNLRIQTKILLIQCIATIFFHTNIQFKQLTKRSLLICFEQLDKNKVGEFDSNLIRDRSLVGILNITYTENQEVFQLCEQINLLDKIEAMLQDFPAEDRDKINILGIYGNLINYHLTHKRNEQQAPYYYPLIIKQCMQQNYNIEVLQKSVEAITNLFQNSLCQKFDVIINLQWIYYGLLQAGFYVEGSQTLLAETVFYFAFQHMAQESTNDYQQMMLKFYQLNQTFAIKYRQKVKMNDIGKSCFCLSIMASIYFHEAEQSKFQDLVRIICNYWIELEDDCNPQFQYYFLRLLCNNLSYFNIANTFYKENKMDIYLQNSINAPAWLIIEQFLEKIRLDDTEKIQLFLSLCAQEHICEMIEKPYKQKIGQKIQGCYYQSNGNQSIQERAEKLISKYLQNQTFQ